MAMGLSMLNYRYLRDNKKSMRIMSASTKGTG